jgi:hypothetical protein
MKTTHEVYPSKRYVLVIQSKFIYYNLKDQYNKCDVPLTRKALGLLRMSDSDSLAVLRGESNCLPLGCPEGHKTDQEPSTFEEVPSFLSLTAPRVRDQSHNQALCHRLVAYWPKFAVIVLNGRRIAGSMESTGVLNKMGGGQ